MGYGLSVAPQNQWEDEDGARHTLRSSGLLRLEASRARVSQALRLVEAQHGWCMWHHHKGHVEMKLKMDGSMRRALSESSSPTLSFSLYYTPGAF
jgi:hypothetical protein